MCGYDPHYVYPSKFPTEAIQVIKERKNICNYIDMPLQHISDRMLKIMRRGTTKKQIIELIDHLRSEIPNIALRTTMLVGHPGETKDDVEELKAFVEQTKFDRLGIFTFSNEEDTHAYKKYEDNIAEAEKTKRADEIMEMQEEISMTLNSKKVGQVFTTLIDKIEDNHFVGRTESDSPEVDNEVLIPKTDQMLDVGQFYNIKINSANSFDLYGTLDNTSII